jgi:Xaa-Pro aminopeptidase
VTCILDGYYGDASRMFIIGEGSERAKKLVRVAKECMDLGSRRCGLIMISEGLARLFRSMLLITDLRW